MTGLHISREICKCCGRISAVGFAVSDDVWRQSVPEMFIESVLCVVCFTRFADESFVEWDKGIVFYPVSYVTHYRRNLP